MSTDLKKPITALLRTTVAAAAVPALLLSGAGTSVATPPCDQWGFINGETLFLQSNGWHMHFKSPGTRAQGKATASALNKNGNPVWMHGTVDGVIEGYAIKLTVHYDGGFVGKYEGSVDADGLASGFTYDAPNPESSGTWRIQDPLQCMTPALS